ncbi:MAG: permease prefix domain 1-containing protein [Oscillospiraceae bacterium]|nr:permease prefix domain 1-containing protein [Oscillospiraceae bacterium]
MKNEMVESYLESLFREIPMTQKARELRDELEADMCERFDDLVQGGVNEGDAFRQVVASLGDVGPMLRELAPDAALSAQINYYRQRKAIGIACGVALYILGVGGLIFGAVLLEPLIGDDYAGVAGLMMLFLCAAVATGLIIYVCSAVPYELTPYLQKPDAEGSYRPGELPQPEEGGSHNPLSKKTRLGQMYQAVNSIFWMLVTAAYLLYSFVTNNWAFSWIIFVAAAAVSEFIKLFFLTKSKK